MTTHSGHEVRETELKYAFSDEQGYKTLCNFLSPPQDEFDQYNHYFYSADKALPGPHGLIRIRVEKGKTLFTVKLEATLSGGLLTCNEYEIPLPYGVEWYISCPSRLWSTGNLGMELLEKLHGRRVPLVWAGRLVNHRTLFAWDRGKMLEVDASFFPDGHKDYEVELETAYPETDRSLLLRLFDSLGISVQPQTKTKYQRFLEHCRSSALTV